jgi:4-diphosphocytidyl-2-C-methyl-D-erythritol kinase
MRVARVQAQAKVNLVLRVGARSHDGYHDIATVFQRIDLADEVVVHLGGVSRSLDCTGPQIPSGGLGPPESNLAFRAALAFAERAVWIRGFAIQITKNIPVGGGLGGGSADAGAVLRALDALGPYSLAKTEPETFMAIATALGADVPFLAREGVRAIGFRRGQVLQTLDPLPSRDVLVAVPSFGISTADAYRWLDEAGGGTLQSGMYSEGIMIDQVSTTDWFSLKRVSHNDFEAVVEPRHPELGNLRQSFASAGATIARLSGSGSTVFGVFESWSPDPKTLAIEAPIISTRTSARVVQVEVLE